MTITFKRTKKFVKPAINLTDEVKDQIGKVMLGSIMENIKLQQQADGSPLKSNPRGYAAQKQAAGWTWQGRVLSLVAEVHRFVKPASWSVSWRNYILDIKPKDADFADIVRNVQERGYVGWFEPSKKGVVAVKGVLTKWIREMFKASNVSK